MDVITSLFLGIIQGITEFIPISSSGHLVVSRNLFGFQEPEMIFDVFVHIATLIAVFIYFRSDLREMIRETYRFIIDFFNKKAKLTDAKERPHVMLSLWVIVGTIPTALIGLLFKDTLEDLFGNTNWVGYMLICTGILLIISKLIPQSYTKRKNVGLLTALIVGIIQGAAIMPGVSRSGSTIVCGMLCGMDRELSGRFSFILSIPAIIGALILQLSTADLTGLAPANLIVGFLAAGITGLAALNLLMLVIKKGNLYLFAPYVIPLGIVVIKFL